MHRGSSAAAKDRMTPPQLIPVRLSTRRVATTGAHPVITTMLGRVIFEREELS